VTGIDRHAALPKFHGRTFAMRAKKAPPTVNRTAPAFGRKAVLYATCFVNYNNPRIGEATLAVLAQNGVATTVQYPGCCGMPQLEHGDLPRLAEMAKKTAAALLPLIEQGYDIVAPVPSCALMMKFEWPLIVPGDEKVARLAQAMFDISEYVVDIARKEGLAPGLSPIEGGVTLHLACHARAQNMGAMGAEMLRQIPDSKVMVVERCSGHGGSLGIKKDFFEVGLKIGKPAMNQIAKNQTAHLCSECPLAGAHLLQGLESIAAETKPAASVHPIQILARSYGLTAGEGR